jgi:hypothetical protein
MENAGRASYVERNQEMINKSDFCVVYYDENYAPPRRKNSRRDMTDYQPRSGTKIAYDYAVRKKNNYKLFLKSLCFWINRGIMIFFVLS